MGEGHVVSLVHTSISYEKIISGTLFLSYNGLQWGHLCHTDIFLVSICHLLQIAGGALTDILVLLACEINL